MRYIILISLLVLVGYQKPHPVQGTYYSNYNSKPGTDKPYQLLQIHCVDDKNLSFYMEVGRGAPDYNSGALYGILTFNKKSGNYEYLPKDTTDDCKLIFIKYKNKIVVHTANGQCPFGYGVYADGTYILKYKTNPKYFYSRTGKKIYFNKTSPKNFSE
ncbi:MAG: hypothetical protein ACHQF4_03900 [Sphingobacteriales bacterium]